ncbi:uncharacterized protein MELLADRAFT_67924 [Melampsora larici-populina 98AG31]|uniref:Uncharacterized protein n=1 Tax=Melampsora larici-populina (strain 98AG31 / pathotype 3-4-7) TaxID=747676 RepID=F4S4Y6_MELLP|nr:uncharacterized protein MELLADRAFT_67924 [Melampsora larici-populina 98AG31]EGG00226.1 hypothetical protein MELLADRAFT_67924 [Melampsora larici-populina 98AG31]
MPYATRARGGGHVGTNTRRRTDSSTSRDSPDPELSLEDSTEDEEEEDEEIPTRNKRKRKTVQLPTIHNFHELGLQWGQARADRILGRQRHLKTRVSPTTLFEAQALQAQYNLDKTMLCIAVGVSRPTLDAALNEGPLAREPNKYTNFQTYSIASTTTPMPPKGQSVGFKERNQIVGQTWSNFSDEEKHISSPTVFEKIIQEVTREVQLTELPIAPPNDLDTSKNLTAEEKAIFIPVFKRLVNMKPIKRDFKHGRLCRHSGKAHLLEKVGIEEINKVVEQLRIIHNKFRFHFHLLVASWNPNTSMTRALYQDEFTSCEHWANHARTDFHLLKRFAVASTQAPSTALKSKTKATKSTPQANIRKELITRLNGLVEAHLPGGRQVKSDTHPQGPNPQITLPTKKFRSGVKLAILRLPGLKVTDEMLSKGAAAGQLPDAQVKLWIEDITANRYLVVKSNVTCLTSHSPSDQDGVAPVTTQAA